MQNRTVDWQDGRLVLVDQTKLPGQLAYARYDDHKKVADAIKSLVVRGAPAIGVAGAFGLALAAANSSAKDHAQLIEDLEEAKKLLQDTRPTAVNLRWGLERAIKAAYAAKPSLSDAKAAVLDAAKKMAEQDISINMAMGKNGAGLIGSGNTVMTHCNAGALATVAYGTALGVIRAAYEQGKGPRVIATETRPVQQGSRLTAYELRRDGIDVRLIPDTAVGYAMAQKMADCVIVGADRILQTGHVYNKIGTYQVAAMAKRHGVPFYVAAPLSTFDLSSRPSDVVIEQRDGAELTGTGPGRTAPEGIGVINPAFDETPPELVSAIITEAGVARPPFEASIPKLFRQ